MATRTTPNRLLLDVGGTFIKCSDGRSIPVDSNAPREEVVRAFKEAVEGCAGAEEVAVAIPGPFDYTSGTFLMRHKYASVYGERFADLVGTPEGVGFKFAHDICAMLLGELRSGAGRGFRNVAIASLGTGLGFCMCLDGGIRKSDAGSPAHSIYNRPYKEGVLEDYISKRGIIRLYEEVTGKAAGEMTVKEIADLAHAGDGAAREAFRRAGGILGEAIAPLLAENGVECLLFGGQISRSFDLMEEAVRERLAEVATLRSISPTSDFDNATFNGLAAL